MDHGRTHLSPGGGYESYDLVGAQRGTRLQIDTVDPLDQTKDMTRYRLTKKEAKDATAANDGWELTSEKKRLLRRKKVAKGAITLLTRMKGGGPVRTPGVVLRRGLELGMPDPNVSNVVQNLGAIASMEYVRERRTIQERLRGLLERLTVRR